MRHEPIEERELEKLQTACRNLVRAIVEGKRHDVPERAVELARYIGHEHERTRGLVIAYSETASAYHNGESTEEAFQAAAQQYTRAREEEREKTLDAIVEFTDLITDQQAEGV